MHYNDRKIVGWILGATVSLMALSGCQGKSATTEATANSSAKPVPATIVANPHAQELAAQHAQGAEADAKKRAAAMSKTTPQ